jgi:hypothetical protein
MSINKYNIHCSKRRSLLRRALEYIKEALAFRHQWKHLQKRGTTPNFLYLKSGARDRKNHDDGLSCTINIEPSGTEETPENDCILNSGSIKEATEKPLDRSGVIQEVTAAPYGAAEETVHKKGPEEAVASPKKTLKNRDSEVRRDQMQLPF